MKTRKKYTKNNVQKELNSAYQLLEGSGISLLDCVRLIKHSLDFKTSKSKLSNILYCTKIIDSGIKHLHIKEVSIENGFEEYIKTKTDLRKSSFEDIKYLGRRLLRTKKYAKMNFSELTISDCQKWLSETYPTPSQFNKAHTMLHGFIQYALRQEWAERNVVKLVQKRKVVEKEIKALSLKETKSLLKTSELPQFKDCQAGLALQIWAGIRPKELTRLKWNDIDLDENTITIRPSTSKTGGSRHIEICEALKSYLQKAKNNRKATMNNDSITPKTWGKKWKSLRQKAGFKDSWIQDVLRHTYASYHTKHFGDLCRLQLNMGHSNSQLLRTRYVNLYNISKIDAKNYFSLSH